MSDAKTDPKIVILILHETLWQSVVSDIFTFSCLAGCILLAHYVGSSVLEILASIIFIISLTRRAMDGFKKNRYTPAEARLKIDEIEKSFT